MTMSQYSPKILQYGAGHLYCVQLKTQVILQREKGVREGMEEGREKEENRKKKKVDLRNTTKKWKIKNAGGRASAKVYSS